VGSIALRQLRFPALLLVTAAGMCPLLARGEPSGEGPRFGLRVMLLGRGAKLMGLPQAASFRSALVSEDAQFGPPLAEALFVLGPGQMLVGVRYSDMEMYWPNEGKSLGFEEKHAQVLTMSTYGLDVGYGWTVCGGGSDTVWFGGRVGAGRGSLVDAGEFGELVVGRRPDGETGFYVDGNLFLAGEHILFWHVGVQAEMGMSVLMLAASESLPWGTSAVQNYWVDVYASLSGVVRF